MKTSLKNVTLRLHLLCILTVSTSCTHSPSQGDYGIQEDRIGYVPARIAVLPTMPWPNGSRYADLPLTNLPQVEQDEIARRLDEIVVNGFRNQPFMRGYSPKAVAKLLEQNDKTALLNEIPNLWDHSKSTCATCTTPAAFYSKSMATRQNWQLWLVELIKNTRNADAVLMPFLMYAFDRTENDRGMLIAEKTVSVALLLIDTNNGSLIWSGGRASTSSNRKLESQTPPAPEMPTLDSVLSRLDVEDIWREFPGRQTL